MGPTLPYHVSIPANRLIARIEPLSDFSLEVRKIPFLSIFFQKNSDGGNTLDSDSSVQSTEGQIAIYVIISFSQMGCQADRHQF